MRDLDWTSSALSFPAITDIHISTAHLQIVCFYGGMLPKKTQTHNYWGNRLFVGLDYFFRMCFLKKRRAAVVLQKNWRAYKARNLKVCGLQTSCWIQSVWLSPWGFMVLSLFSLLLLASAQFSTAGVNDPKSDASVSVPQTAKSSDHHAETGELQILNIM